MWSRGYILKRDGKRDLAFQGSTLTFMRSDEDQQGPRCGRWTELEIYSTIGGNYVASVVHRSCWRCELDRHEAFVASDPADLLKQLEAHFGECTELMKETVDAIAYESPEFRNLLVEEIE